MIDSGLVGRKVFFDDRISRGEKMTLRGTDPESYITFSKRREPPRLQAELCRRVINYTLKGDAHTMVIRALSDQFLEVRPCILVSGFDLVFGFDFGVRV